MVELNRTTIHYLHPTSGRALDRLEWPGVARLRVGVDPRHTVRRMAGDAYDTIKRFWEIQDDGDYAALSPLFADDAEVVDPIYGTFVGGEAIAGFFTMMNDEMGKIGATFRLIELSGDDETAWAQWEVTTNDKPPRQGVGVYRVRHGQLTYYKDYMNA